MATFKNAIGVRMAKVAFGAMASIGAGAVVGCIVRNQDLSNLKGLGKLCAGVGISGLSLWAGNEAKNAVRTQIDDVAALSDNIFNVIDGATEKAIYNVANECGAVKDDSDDTVVVTEEELE